MSLGLARRGSETMAGSRWPQAAVTFSVRAPTTNPFLTNSKKSDDRNVHKTHIHTVEARTFPTV